MLILNRHIDRCVSNAIKNNGVNSREVIDELMALFFQRGDIRKMTFIRPWARIQESVKSA